MKQIFLHKGKISTAEVNPPLLDAHHILVRVLYSFVSSGTEQATIHNASKSLLGRYFSNIADNTQKIIGAVKEHGFASTMALTQEKLAKVLPLGYSCTGQVVAVGEAVEKYRIGDYVACAGSAWAHHADMVSVPQNLAVKIYNHNLIKELSLSTIGAIALHGVRRAQLQIGERVCVLGLGLIGQITAQLVKNSGCSVIGVDVQSNRLDTAKQLGADVCLNPMTTDVAREIAFSTGHKGVDTTIITAASASGDIIQQAMQITRKRGRVVLVGDVPIQFDREPFYAKEIDFVVSCSTGPGRYDASYELESKDYPYSYVRWTENRNMECFAALVQEKKISIAPLISQEFDIADAEHAYDFLQKNAALGVVFSYRSSRSSIDKYLVESVRTGAVATSTMAKPYVHSVGTLNVSMIGVGGFAKVKLLPLIAKMRNVSIHSIIDADTANALTLARVYQAQRISNDIRKILGDDDINVAIIATPHAFHADQAIACLAAGKAVLVEKPAAVTFEQLAMLKTFLAVNPNVLFTVDFNRSSAPFMVEIKKVLEARSNPMMITYRMNANYLPKDHWIQSDLHRGRIVGEACHIFELFCFLVNAKPVSVAVSPMNPTTDDMLITDNVSITVSMSDGSCCTLLYTSLGDHRFGKEYMEIFVDGKTIVMNDFTELSGYGLPADFSRKSGLRERGHEQLFKQFFKAAHHSDGQLPIPIDRIITASELTLIADKLARAGGGFEYLV